jgi:hypothetical protein
MRFPAESPALNFFFLWEFAWFHSIVFLRRFCQIVSGFHFFEFHDKFFTEQGRGSCIQPPTWKNRSVYLDPPVTGWPSYTPEHWVPYLSPSSPHTATRFHTGVSVLCCSITRQPHRI